MTTQHERRANSLRWIERAKHDQVAAEHLLTLGDRCPTEIVCFHCQQAVEKSLKAILAFRGMASPKTHDLLVLVNLVDCPDLVRHKSDLSRLNRYAVETRYPGVWEEISLAEAKLAEARTREIHSVIEDLLSRES